MQEESNNGLFGTLAVGVAIGALMAGTIALLWYHDRDASRPPQRAAYQVPDSSMARMNDSMAGPVADIDPAVARVASQIVCACGKCKDLVTACTCGTAQQERAFIQGELQAGRTETEIIEAVLRRYRAPHGP